MALQTFRTFNRLRAVAQPLAAALVVASLSFWSGPGSAGTVTINASTPVSETGGDDMVAMRRIFQDSSFPETNGGLPPAWPVIAPLAPQMVRLIDVFGDCGLDAAGNFVTCPLLEGQLGWLAQYNLSPHVVVGTSLPAGMSGNPESWDAASWARYQTFAIAAVKYVATQFGTGGFPQVMFEVCNELDITTAPTDMWPFDPANPPPIADPRRFAMEQNLYRVWANAVDLVAKANPTRTIQVAGPAMGSNSTFMTSAFWHVQFVKWVAANNLRLDAVTLHFYGGLEANSGNGPLALRDLGGAIRAALNAAGRGSVPIYLSEWGPSSWTDPNSAWGADFGRFNYRYPSAAWSAAFLRESLAGTFTGGTLLLMRDQMGNNTIGSPGIPSYTWFQNGTDFPKPYTNVFQMAMLMPGQRRAVVLPSATQPTIGALASTSATSAAVMVYNYKHRFDWNNNLVQDQTTTQSVAAQFTGLPFSTGRVTARRYLVDAATSNVGSAIDAGTLPVLSTVTLQQVETITNIRVRSGATVSLPARNLTPSAVTLWVITRQ